MSGVLAFISGLVKSKQLRVEDARQVGVMVQQMRKGTVKNQATELLRGLEENYPQL
jgi:hypothetical protein